MSQSLAQPDQASARCAAPAFFSMQQVANLILGSERALRHMIADGRGPRVTRIGRRKLVRADHLHEWLDGLAA